jgi:hypothetical protein
MKMGGRQQGEFMLVHLHIGTRVGLEISKW